MRRSILLALASSAAFGLPASSVLAQQYPVKTVRIIVPATPGGTSDIFARALAARLQGPLGQSVIVEYKPGAGTNIGSDYVAKSAPDGHTLLINGITLAVNPLLYPNMPFDPAKDLVPVIEVAQMLNVVTVHPDVPAASMKDLVQLVKQSPGKFHYGTPGAGSSGRLAGELFALKTGTKITHISYQGNAQATTDHIGGTLQLGFVNLPVALQFVKSGKLKALAVTSAKRSPALPDVPTVAEALGIADYELTGWFGLMAPAGTPAAVIARIQQEADRALGDAALREVFSAAGGDVVGGSTAQFDARIRNDTKRLGELIRLSGAALDK
jgi:tripartite-type tricarboxylate transporter receptor subunit TctC